MREESTEARPVDPEFLPERLREEVSRAARHRLPLALLVFDLDTPSESRESLDALTRAAMLLARCVVRRSDVVGPLGSGRFGVVANATPEGADALARCLVSQLQGFEFTAADRPVPMGLRFALSCHGAAKTAGDLLAEAHAALGQEQMGERVR
ncbi:MAG: diguanylate cyclase [Planctomycetes bacterium]|nr:diguanylate cyclase [Planctomycetota bacterium]